MTVDLNNIAAVFGGSRHIHQLKVDVLKSDECSANFECCLHWRSMNRFVCSQNFPDSPGLTTCLVALGYLFGLMRSCFGYLTDNGQQARGMIRPVKLNPSQCDRFLREQSRRLMKSKFIPID